MHWFSILIFFSILAVLSCAARTQHLTETKELTSQTNNIRSKWSKQENSCSVYGQFLVNGARRGEISGQSCATTALNDSIDPEARNIVVLKTVIPNVFSSKGPSKVVLVTQFDLTAQVSVDSQIVYKNARSLVSKSNPIEFHPFQVIERMSTIEIKKSDVRRLLEQLVDQINKRKSQKGRKGAYCEATWVKNLSLSILSGVGYLKRPGWPDFLEMQLNSITVGGSGTYERGLGSVVSIPLKQYITYNCEDDRFSLAF